MKEHSWMSKFTSGNISPNLMVVIQNVDVEVDLWRLMLNDALHIFHSQLSDNSVLACSTARPSGY